MLNKIRDIISEQLNIEKDTINESTSFYDDLGADSLDLFQIVAELEEVFEIEVSTEDVEKIKTVDDALRYIKKIKGEN